MRSANGNIFGGVGTSSAALCVSAAPRSTASHLPAFTGVGFTLGALWLHVYAWTLAKPTNRKRTILLVDIIQRRQVTVCAGFEHDPGRIESAMANHRHLCGSVEPYALIGARNLRH
ncbi:MAG TPA: hypothetical protein VGM43_23180, partial [Bryobacteraceae bacterium]